MRGSQLTLRFKKQLIFWSIGLISNTHFSSASDPRLYLHKGAPTTKVNLVAHRTPLHPLLVRAASLHYKKKPRIHMQRGRMKSAFVVAVASSPIQPQYLVCTHIIYTCTCCYIYTIFGLSTRTTQKFLGGGRLQQRWSYHFLLKCWVKHQSSQFLLHSSAQLNQYKLAFTKSFYPRSIHYLFLVFTVPTFKIFLLLWREEDQSPSVISWEAFLTNFKSCFAFLNKGIERHTPGFIDHEYVWWIWLLKPQDGLWLCSFDQDHCLLLCVSGPSFPFFFFLLDFYFFIKRLLLFLLLSTTKLFFRQPGGFFALLT